MKNLILLLIAFAAISFSSGCVVSLGSGSKASHQFPTIGQELIDLHHAKNRGAITEEEYAIQKELLLRGR